MNIKDSNQIIQNDLEILALAELPWGRLAGKSIMVTGGGGFLASYLVKTLLFANDIHDLGLTVICVTRSKLSVKQRLKDFLNMPQLVLVDHDVSLQLPENFPDADFIIHSASQASPKFYSTDPVGTLKVNSVGTMYLLEHAVKHGSDGFLFFSSGEVYGQSIDDSQPITELDYGYMDPIQVRSCYAEGKRIGETMCAAWSHQFGLHTNVVRPFHTYGPGMALDDGRVFADFVADVLAKRDIVLKSDGLARRPFCYIADATLGFLTVLLKGKFAQAYNVANPYAEISMRDLAYTLAGLFPEIGIGVFFDKSTPSNAYLKSPITRQCPSIQKIADIGWRPETDIETGFRRAITSYF